MAVSVARTDRFRNLPKPKDDIVFKLDALSRADNDANRVNLVIGAYRDANGSPYVLRIVRKAEQLLLDKKFKKEYLPIDGLREFCDLSVKLLLGADMKIPMSHVARVQCLSGTGACRIAADLYAKTLPPITAVYLSNPTWANHRPIFASAGFSDIRTYRYFDRRTNGFNFKGMSQDLNNAPDNSIIVLHLCAHNPTGADPTPEEWERLADICSAKGHYPLFDCAYQGYASGDLDRDAFAARLFMRKGIEFFAAQSYAKNMGLYGERVGCFIAVTGSDNSQQLVQSMAKSIVRPMYSNPPLHGARIVCAILGDAKLREEWRMEVKSMADRIILMRRILFEELQKKETPGDWEHIVRQIGMFSYTGLTYEQCERLQREFHIYIMLSGRANMAGLTTTGAKYFAYAIDAVVRGIAPSAKL